MEVFANIPRWCERRERSTSGSKCICNFSIGKKIISIRFNLIQRREPNDQNQATLMTPVRNDVFWKSEYPAVPQLRDSLNVDGRGHWRIYWPGLKTSLLYPTFFVTRKIFPEEYHDRSKRYQTREWPVVGGLEVANFNPTCRAPFRFIVAGTSAHRTCCVDRKARIIKVQCTLNNGIRFQKRSKMNIKWWKFCPVWGASVRIRLLLIWTLSTGCTSTDR